MFNLSDKELDRLSREAAAAYEVKSKTSSWEALEQRLDQELGTAPTPHPAVPPPRGLLYPFAYSSLVILLIGTGYLLLKSGKKTNTNDKKNFTLHTTNSKSFQKDSMQGSAAAADYKDYRNADKGFVPANGRKYDGGDMTNRSKEETSALNVAPGVTAGSETNSPKSNTGLSPAAEKNEPKYKALNGAALSGDKEHLTGNNAAKISRLNHFRTKQQQQKNPGIAAENDKSNKSSKLTSTENTRDNPKNSVIGERLIQDPSVSPAFGEKSTAAAEINRSYVLTTQLIPAGKHVAIHISDSSLLAETTKVQSTGKVIRKNRSLLIQRPLAIGISYAPDFSKVKNAYADNPIGRTIGFTVDYHFLPRLAVNAGFLLSHKYYEMSGEGFHPAIQNVAPVNADIEFVKGSFKMIELPLNLQYDLGFQDNSTFFVSAGLSSYLIQKQYYSYYCHYNLGYPGWIHQTYSIPQNFWFSMLNLSAGFETSLNKYISFQMNPYLRIPLKGVGAGNVQLSSFGINVALKYAPVLKRSRH